MATDRTGFIDIVDITGSYFTDTSIDDFVMYTENSNQGILIGTLQSNISSISIRSNITTITGTLNINGVTGMLLPKGTTAQRPSVPVQGQVRYNSDVNTFEGYGAGNAWGSLGGVKDTNQDTYISAESYPTSNDDILRFYNSNIESLRVIKGGYIGISNQAPSERLELSGGNAKFNSNLYIINRLGVSTSNPTEQIDTIGNLKVSSNIYALSKLGIANSNPMEQLDITGNIKTSSNVYILQNLSVGKSNPTTTVDILGNTAIDGSVNTTKYIVSRGIQVLNRSALTYSNTLPSGIVMGFSNDSQGVNITMLNNTATNYFRFLASNNEVLRITGTGYIGIGTQIPTEALSVLNGKIYSTTQVLGTTSDTSNSPSFSFKEDSNTGIYHVVSQSIGVVTGGVEQVRFNLSNIQVGNNTAIIGSNIQSYAPLDYGTLRLSIPGTISGTVPVTSNNPFNSSMEGSLSFDGSTGNYITLTSTQYLFNWWSSGGFTLEAWVNFSAFSNAWLIGNMLNYSTTNYWSFGPTNTGNLNFYYFNGSGNSITTSTTLSTNTWTHIAVSCDTTNIRLFINGTLSQTTALSGTPQLGLTGLVIGQYNNVSINALITNLRIVKGACLYTATFTPSTTPLTPSSSGTTILLLRVPQNTGRVIIPKIGGGTQIYEFPPAALNSSSTLVQNTSYGSGTYYATSSSTYIYSAYVSFDKSTATFWQAPTSLYRQTSPYDYIGSVSTIDTTGNVYTGEWLQIQLPCSIILSSFTLTSLSGASWSYPSTFQILGSLDSTNWLCLSKVTGNVSLSATYNVNASQAYMYYRLVIFSQTGAYLNNSPTVCEFILYGSQESLVTSSDGQVGIGVSRPVQPLEVSGNTIIYGNIYANNLGMFRNKIINGDMSFDQRNSGSAQNTANMVYYLDRWSIYQGITTGNISIQRVALTSSDSGPYEKGFKYSIKCTVTTALSNYTFWILQQLVEGIYLSDLNWDGNSIGTPITLSFWFKAAQTGYYNVVLRNFNGSAQSWIQLITVSQANVWAFYSLTIPPPPGSGAQWNANNNICQLQLQLGSLVKTNQASAGWSAPGNAPECVTGFTDWVTTVNNYIQLTGVQLEKGNIATPFDFRPYHIELQLCQRYYEKSFPVSTTPAFNLQNSVADWSYCALGTSNSTFWSTKHSMSQPKRTTTYTLTFYNPYGASGQYSVSGNGAITVTPSAQRKQASTFVIDFTDSNAQNKMIHTSWTCDAEL